MPGKEYYVSLQGSDTSEGTLEKPFFSLERARDEIRKFKAQEGLPEGGFTVNIRQGFYTLSHEPVEKLDFQAWQAKGLDKGSIAADPMLESRDNDDFRLKASNQAFAIGFKSLPIDEIGLYNSGRRRVWPVIEAEGAREKPLV